MLAGATTVRSVFFDLSTFNPNLQGLLPADFEGKTAPPAGSPTWVLGTNQTATRALQLFSVQINFANPSSSTFSSVATLPVAAYNLDTCAQPCITQPNTPQVLDPISDGRLMFRLQYRNFDDHEAQVTNHNVDVDGTHHFGVRWYELRRSGAGLWSLFQQGTYAPDSDNRWMGSAALDGFNNLAIGYSVSGTTTFPSVRYAGRVPTDPLGTLGQGEATLVAGGGSQTHPSGRWGDYSALTVDPGDDCSFWYTRQYYSTTSDHSWRTRIGSFRLPPCGVPGTDASMLPQPVRIVDTRSAGGPIAAGQSRCFALAGQGGIPANAAGAVVNVTAVGYSDFGWLTLYPNGQPVPATSTLNFDHQEYAVANGATVKIGNVGQVCVNAGRSASQVILDVTGYLPTATGQVQMLPQPVRAVDTRLSGAGQIPAGQSRCFALAGVPANATDVVLNATAVGYASLGWLTLYPNGQPVPATSTLNFDPHEYAIANSAIVKVGTGGQVCVNAGLAASDAILDVGGFLANSPGQVQMLVQPVRLLDTRQSGGPIGAGQSRCVTLSGLSGIPASASGLIVNLTGVGYAALGWLTLFPSGQGVPATSTLNFDPHEYAIANGAIGAIGTGGHMCINAGNTASDAIVDAAGYILP